jgi:hypothetical protein
MGSETRCRVAFLPEGSHAEQVADGKALLETDHLLFRGDFRLAIPLAEIRSLTDDAGQLAVTFPGGVARFELGPLAARWATKIRSPKGLLDKLGVKPGARVLVLGVADPDFLALLEARAGDVAQRLRGDNDLVFLFADERRVLERLAELSARLKPDGAIWVVRPKGRTEITEQDVLSLGRAAGLVDVKVARYSATHTAEKLVVPVARRR